MACKYCHSPTKHVYGCQGNKAHRKLVKPAKRHVHRLPNGRPITIAICEEWYRVVGVRIMAESGQRIFQWLIEQAKQEPNP